MRTSAEVQQLAQLRDTREKQLALDRQNLARLDALEQLTIDELLQTENIRRRMKVAAAEIDRVAKILTAHREQAALEEGRRAAPIAAPLTPAERQHMDRIHSGFDVHRAPMARSSADHERSKN